MRREYRTHVDISARAERVWEVLTDLESYKNWNPFILRARGRLREGSAIKIQFRLHNGLVIPAKPRIIKVEPCSRISWEGWLVTPRLLGGEHRFLLREMPQGVTRLTQREIYGGILLPWVWWHLKRDAEKGFHAMNQALKNRVEKGIEH